VDERPAAEPTPGAPLPEVPPTHNIFSDLGLVDRLAHAVEKMGFTEPTPIQQQAIPVILAGRDVIGSAQTGTGKTAAFALPILQHLGEHGALRCLILEPTRELALQVEEAFRDFGKFTNLRSTVIYGGVGYGRQREDLHRGVDIVMATPGRLLDLLEQRDLTLSGVDILVLDEVDRMLDMGFLPDVKRIVQQCPRERQTLLFTATLPPEIESLAAWVLRDPVTVSVGRRQSPAETISHAFYPVVEAQKFDLLRTLLERTSFKSVLIFCRTKVGADRVAAWLKTHHHSVAVMHADRNQSERQEALAGFKAGRYEVLVATDLAARGLDIAGVTHVINYDVPENPEDYVHRIGRTGRAHHLGDAFTLVTESSVRDARSIERFIGRAIEWKRIDDFPYVYSALFDQREQFAEEAAKPSSRLHRGMRR
jgi:ATP-dependent RNA helicase RhlE